MELKIGKPEEKDTLRIWLATNSEGIEIKSSKNGIIKAEFVIRPTGTWCKCVNGHLEEE